MDTTLLDQLIITPEQRRKVNRCLRNIIKKIDNIPVEIEWFQESEELVISLKHQTVRTYNPIIESLHGHTLRDALKLLSIYKIPRIVDYTPSPFMTEVIKMLSQDKSNVTLSIVACCVCYNLTDWKLKCEHFVCPYCVHRVSVCPMCRVIIAEY